MARQIRWGVVSRGLAHAVEIVGVVFRIWVITQTDWLRGLTITMTVFETLGILGSIVNRIPGFYFGALLPITFGLRLGGLLVSLLAVDHAIDYQLAAIIGVGVGGVWTIFEFLLMLRLGLRAWNCSRLAGLGFRRAICSRYVLLQGRSPGPGEWQCSNGDWRVTDYSMPLYIIGHVLLLPAVLVVRIVWMRAFDDAFAPTLLATVIEGTLLLIGIAPFLVWEPRCVNYQASDNHRPIPVPLKWLLLAIAYGIGLLVGVVVMFVDLLNGPNRWNGYWSLSGVATLLLIATVVFLRWLVGKIPSVGRGLLNYVCPRKPAEGDPAQPGEPAEQTQPARVRRPEPV